MDDTFPTSGDYAASGVDDLRREVAELRRIVTALAMGAEISPGDISMGPAAPPASSNFAAIIESLKRHYSPVFHDGMNKDGKHG